MSRLSYFRFQAKVWLFFVGLFALLWAVLWWQVDETEAKVLTQKQKQGQTVAMPTKIERMTELYQEVAPVKFETITRDLRSYPAEFKDKKYFDPHSKKWAVQVMDVAEHKVITDYLDTRPNREKFAYFRYNDTNNKPRYILTYGIWSSAPEAIGAAKLTEFNLPPTAELKVEEIRRYLDIIDEYERIDGGDGGKNQPREIKLSPTNYEIPVAPIHRLHDTTPPKPKNKDKKSEKPKSDKPKANTDEAKRKNSEKPKSEYDKFQESKAKAEANARKAKADESPVVGGD